MTSLRFASKARCVENYLTTGPDGSDTRKDDQSMVDAQKRIIEGLQHKLRALEQEQLEKSRNSGGGARSVQDMAESGFLDQWMVKHFQGLRHELEEKEQQLELKTRLLSERERQLGQLCEQL